MSEHTEMSMQKSVTQRRLGRAVLLVGALMLSALNPAFGDRPAAQAPEASPTDQIIIKLRQSERAQAASLDAGYVASLSAIANAGLQHSRRMSGDAQVFKLPGSLPIAAVQAIARRLSAHPDVEYAEPDYIMQPMLFPNDPLYTNQWHYKEFTAEVGGANLPAAWDITTGSVTQVVAVIDTGLLPHVDIDTDILDTTAGRVAPGYDFITNTTTANDGGGRDSDPSDPGDGCNGGNSSWHGTHVAGTIGALSNNGAGVAGVNWTSKILPVRVLGRCGGALSDIADGMRWAAGLSVSGVTTNANPAKVLNLSLGGGGACGATFQTAIDAIVAAGSVVVVAAGNSNADASNFQPANCNSVITVAANNRSGDRAYYSNFSTTLIEISAPGGAQGFTNDPNGVLSTLNSGTTTPAADNYVYYQGTSMAAPHVAGIASLMLSVNSALTPAQVLDSIRATARPFAGGTTCLLNNNCGAGIINAAAAVVAAATGDTTPPTVPGSLLASAVSSSQINTSWVASTDSGGSGLAGYKIERCTGSGCTSFAQIATTTATSYSDTGRAASTTYAYQVRAYDNIGNNSGYSNTASATTQVAPTIGGTVDNTALTWTTGGNANWFGQTAVSFFGGDAVQSGLISDNQTSWVETTVTGPRTLTFYWKVSSELGWDFLRFYVGGVEQSGRISGAVDWIQKTYSIASGSHTLRWAYTKDGSVNSGSDAGWLDQVILTAVTDTTPPTVPGSLSASAVSSSQINTSWTASADSGGSGLAGYKIEQCSGGRCTGFIQIATTTATSYSNTGLAARTTYRYRVRAYDAAGNNSAYSNIVSATTTRR